VIAGFATGARVPREHPRGATTARRHGKAGRVNLARHDSQRRRTVAGRVLQPLGLENGCRSPAGRLPGSAGAFALGTRRSFARTPPVSVSLLGRADLRRRRRQDHGDDVAVAVHGLGRDERLPELRPPLADDMQRAGQVTGRIIAEPGPDPGGLTTRTPASPGSVMLTIYPAPRFERSRRGNG
jgi:hypothetical protein